MFDEIIERKERHDEKKLDEKYKKLLKKIENTPVNYYVLEQLLQTPVPENLEEILNGKNYNDVPMVVSANGGHVITDRMIDVMRYLEYKEIEKSPILDSYRDKKRFEGYSLFSWGSNDRTLMDQFVDMQEAKRGNSEYKKEMIALQAGNEKLILSKAEAMLLFGRNYLYRSFSIDPEEVKSQKELKEKIGKLYKVKYKDARNIEERMRNYGGQEFSTLYEVVYNNTDYNDIPFLVADENGNKVILTDRKIDTIQYCKGKGIDINNIYGKELKVLESESKKVININDLCSRYNYINPEDMDSLNHMIELIEIKQNNKNKGKMITVDLYDEQISINERMAKLMFGDRYQELSTEDTRKFTISGILESIRNRKKDKVERIQGGFDYEK